MKFLIPVVVGTLAELRLEVLNDGAVNIIFVPFRRIKAHSLSTGMRRSLLNILIYIIFYSFVFLNNEMKGENQVTGKGKKREKENDPLRF